MIQWRLNYINYGKKAQVNRCLLINNKQLIFNYNIFIEFKLLDNLYIYLWIYIYNVKKRSWKFGV